MIGILDYGVGNVGSIQNMLKKAGASSLIVHAADVGAGSRSARDRQQQVDASANLYRAACEAGVQRFAEDARKLMETGQSLHNHQEPSP